MSEAVLLISHGSHSPKTKEEVDLLVQKFRQRDSRKIWEYAFLEIERPGIPEGIERCVRQGAQTITVLLNFLNSGKHVDQDIPRIVSEERQKYPAIPIRITRPVGRHPGIVAVFFEMLSEE